MSFDITKFMGPFKIRDSLGNPSIYPEGSVVDYKGKQYVAIKRTSGFSPLHAESKSGWRQLTSTQTMNFTNSETEPELPNEGDHWFNSSKGVLLIYIK